MTDATLAQHSLEDANHLLRSQVDELTETVSQFKVSMTNHQQRERSHQMEINRLRSKVDETNYEITRLSEHSKELMIALEESERSHESFKRQRDLHDQ